MQNDLARSFLNVPAPPAPAPPKPQDKPAPVTASKLPLSKYCQENKCVALTFDDGPGKYTEKLLDVLKKYNAKATFFVLGQEARKHPNLLKRMVSEGHSIGNHSLNHKDLTKLNSGQIKDNIEEASRIIQSITNTKPNLIRPPYGSLNQNAKTVLADLGYTIVLWSVDTRDWADRNSTIVASRASLNSQRNSIVLMHDIHPTTVDAVEDIIKNLLRKDFKLVSIDQMRGQ